ncbi:hypothetical protein Glo7428_0997 [Gloeocapsa sp. PCC 7428]|uniref:DUF7734 family protein n=1 Tax=Gloeocapsa sp. PCC 7428 TaxID=1173026 RepID=UPI0002A5D4CF|nr:hypothetical protein [Gloeocapsa sp. PCC 7428]AFZ29575.1 hypothetical protein Glo7428_0997 [Gloeocapsa sp. PCC 7428]
MNNSIGKRLEQYTVKRPQEVLVVTVEVDGELDQIAIFKGFSSSLMRPTAFDPEVPVLSDNAKILTIDRVASPYNPQSPRYIEQELTWDSMQVLLLEVGV